MEYNEILEKINNRPEECLIEVKDTGKIDKIKNVEVKTEDVLITPVEHEVRLRNDEDIRNVSFDEIKKNIPKTVGNFVEVVVMVND